MKKNRFAILLLPIVFIGLSIVYKDSFYIFLAVTSLLFSVLIVLPSLFAKIAILKHSKANKNIIAKEEEYVKDAVGSIEKRINFHNPFSLIGVLFLIFTAFFTYIAVNNLSIIPDTHNLFIEYYQSQFFFLKSALPYFLVGILASSCILSILLSKDKILQKKIISGIKQFPRNLAFVASGFAAGFLFSFVAVYLFGLGEVNFTAVKINVYPTSAGIIAGKDAVIKKLQNSDDKFSILGSGGNIKNTILSQLIVREDGENSYYTERIIKTIPQSLLLPINIPKQSLIMVGNTLIVNELNKEDIQAVSPTIAKIMVKHHFKSRYLKDNLPKVTVMGRQDYLVFREKQIDEQVAKLDDALQEVKDYISGIYGSISTDKQKIAVNQNGLSSSISQRDSAYDYCINAGYYFYGYFYHTFTQSYCDSSKSSWDNIIAGYQKNISDWQQQLQYDQKELSDYRDLDSYLTDIRGIVDSQRDATPQELGVFEPQDNIKVVLDSTSPNAVDNYLETLAHEYLHYASYISDERQLDHFFEEGLTEYYARKAIKSNIGVDINLGYPLISKLIEQMMKKIPESVLQDIYFTKDQTQLSALLDEAYGKNFYEDTQLYFTGISYAPPDRALKIANNIMFRIGGKELNESDLYSSSLSN